MTSPPPTPLTDPLNRMRDELATHTHALRIHNKTLWVFASIGSPVILAADTPCPWVPDARTPRDVVALYYTVVESMFGCEQRIAEIAAQIAAQIDAHI